MANIWSSFSTCHRLPADYENGVLVFFFFSNQHEVKQSRLCFVKTEQ